MDVRINKYGLLLQIIILDHNGITHFVKVECNMLLIENYDPHKNLKVFTGIFSHQ